MKSTQIMEYMLQDPFICSYFGGVLASDQIPLTKVKKSLCVVNTDASHLPGKHWVVVWYDKVPEHFDPLGTYTIPTIEKSLLTNRPRFRYNSQQVQSPTSRRCGEVCVFYVYYKCRGYSMKKIWKNFPDTF